VVAPTVKSLKKTETSRKETIKEARSRRGEVVEESMAA